MNTAMQDANAPLSARKARRPLSVTLLALFVLTFTCINLIRFYQAIKQWEFLASQPGVSPLYIALSGLVWLLVGFPLFFGLWAGLPWSPRLARIAVVAYSLYAWLDRIVVARQPVIIGTGFAWPLLASLYILGLVLIFWVLSRRLARAFFKL